MRVVVCVVGLITALGITACASREEKLQRLAQKRELLLLELRELPGYADAREEVLADARKPPSPMDQLTRKMNAHGAAGEYFAEKDAQAERDLTAAADEQFGRVCLALGMLRAEGKSDSAIDPDGQLKTFFDAPATGEKCIEAWAAEAEMRAIVKDG